MRSHLLIAARVANRAAEVGFTVGVLQIFGFPPSTPSENPGGRGVEVFVATLQQGRLVAGQYVALLSFTWTGGLCVGPGSSLPLAM